MDLISVIIPVYNVDKYLKRCINSVINQTYRNIEIVLVDDGSSDKSSKICDKYASKDSRIKVVHKINEGVSVARNVGMQIATGEFLCFVDSDDFLPKHSVEYLYRAIEKENADMSVGCWTMINPKGDRSNCYEAKKVQRNNKKELMEVLSIPEIKGPVAKLFRTQIIKTNHLEFPKNILVSEDTIFVYQYAKYCESMCVINNIVYYYNRLSINSTTTKYYEKFHEVSLMCVKGYIENVVGDGVELGNLILQKKIINDFLAVKGYFLHFVNENKEEIKKKLQETYSLFKPYISMLTIWEYPHEFKDFLDLYPYLDSGQMEYVIKEHSIRHRKKSNRIKKALTRVVVKIKMIAIYKFQMGYKEKRGKDGK
ncbi:MAG: glycosyltransferase family 2 protein [Clostridia bacterium]|nr:glycosyltransferase family 2 protein [Clostridia bacterium]